MADDVRESVKALEEELKALRVRTAATREYAATKAQFRALTEERERLTVECEKTEASLLDARARHQRASGALKQHSGWLPKSWVAALSETGERDRWRAHLRWSRIWRAWLLTMSVWMLICAVFAWMQSH